ncbi:MAG: hypothetical protein H6850_00875 [Alphaproteobacteria bacterium]|nr:MAG: hypothetical protein H6850_00875 [Alphaproteobacteria bacterium]
MLFYIVAETIGVIVPMEHDALKEIVKEFEKTLDRKHKVIVKNAMGDSNLQRSIIQYFNTQKIDLFAPIGTAATQMTTSIARGKNILGIASYQVKGAKVLQDEVTAEPILNLIKENFSNIKTLALVYSHNEKILPEIKHAQEVCKKLNINVQLMPVYTAQDIYTVSKSIKAEGVLILKDHIVVSGLTTLLKIGLPVFASDHISVQKGALCAIGVHEGDIGIAAAQLSNKLLKGEQLADVSHMKTLKVFVNKDKTKGMTLKTSYEKVYY